VAALLAFLVASKVHKVTSIKGDNGWLVCKQGRIPKGISVSHIRGTFPLSRVELPLWPMPFTFKTHLVAREVHEVTPESACKWLKTIEQCWNTRRKRI
jgi:hypothetical protein